MNPRVPGTRRSHEGRGEDPRSGILTNGPLVKEFEAAAADYLGVRQCVAVAPYLRPDAGASGLRSVGLGGRAHILQVHGDRARPWRTVCGPSSPTSTAPPSRSRPTAPATPSACGLASPPTRSTPRGRREPDGPGPAPAVSGCSSTGPRLRVHAGRPTKVGGFGDAEVFSLSPTKVVVSGEGGIVATNDEVLAERVRIGRELRPRDLNVAGSWG